MAGEQFIFEAWSAKRSQLTDLPKNPFFYGDRAETDKRKSQVFLLISIKADQYSERGSRYLWYF